MARMVRSANGAFHASLGCQAQEPDATTNQTIQGLKARIILRGSKTTQTGPGRLERKQTGIFNMKTKRPTREARNTRKNRAEDG
jgi:hypothetical protein